LGLIGEGRHAGIRCKIRPDSVPAATAGRFGLQAFENYTNP
jgi:hypothetical protein